MKISTSRTNNIRRNNFQSSMNPQVENSSSFRFNSPSLKLGRVRSWKFVYQSPSRVQQCTAEGPLTFNKQAHKLVVRKLPKFHEEIFQNDPLKNSKIIENINYFREQEKNKRQMQDSHMITRQNSKVSDGNVEVSRILVDVKQSRSPQNLRMTRSLSGSYKVLASSRMSVIEGLKNGESLYESMVKHQVEQDPEMGPLTKRSQKKIDLAQSQYFSGIFGR